MSKRCLMDYGKFLTARARRRRPNLIRNLTEAYMRQPDALFFAGGMPNAQLFPFRELRVRLDGDPEHSSRRLSESELAAALQYGPSQGYPPLLAHWRQFQRARHSPPYEHWDVQMSSGSMEACGQLLELLVGEGEALMLQSPTYTGVLGALLPMQPELLRIEMDEEGALPERIAEVCESRLAQGRAVPKLLYVNPTGANPDGTCYSGPRKRQIYALAQRYDFLILEDDAYYFLHFLERQPTSFLSLDRDGRVLRLDSFSKILSAGLRLGALTGPRALLDRVALHTQASTLHACALSQVLVHKLLSDWGEQRLEEHLARLRAFYRERRDLMLRALDQHFAGIAEWSVPRGGMFVWLKLTGLPDSYDLVMRRCVPQGVFALPGHAFYPDSSLPCPYIRLCYSQAEPKDVHTGLAKMASIIRQAAAEQ